MDWRRRHRAPIHKVALSLQSQSVLSHCERSAYIEFLNIDSAAQARKAMDLPKIKALIDLLNSSGLSALELAEGEHSVRLERHANATARTTAPDSAAPTHSPAHLVSATHAPAQTATRAGRVIAAPMQGIFHLTPAPGEPPFVKIGDEVQLEQVVCVIEAMKMFNTVESDQSGRIAEVLVSSGSEVKVGQALFRLA
jgi:acetyl-CoA carboxylase biotin carboxyl carrier protein